MKLIIKIIFILFLLSASYAIDIVQKIESPYIFWTVNPHQTINDIYLLDKNFTEMNYGNSQEDYRNSYNYIENIKGITTNYDSFFNSYIENNIKIEFYSKNRINNNVLYSLGIETIPFDNVQSITAFSNMYLIDSGHDPNYLNRYAVLRLFPSGIDMVLGNLSTINTESGRRKAINDEIGTISPNNGLIIMFRHGGRYINPEFFLNSKSIEKKLSILHENDNSFFFLIPEIFELLTVSDNSYEYYNNLITEEEIILPIDPQMITNEINNEDIIGLQIPCDMGTDIVSPVSGQVIRKSYSTTFGHYIVIRSRNGIDFILGHLQNIYIKNSDFVNTGDNLGTSGFSGHTATSSLYYSISVNNIYYNIKDMFF